ncbi:cytochrome P450 2B5-like [Mytilus californianus]|uniref:cytochrome P450 2B5-like n=1 Tax=Mytilus californianus TaxID=6549 RepID=UPI00224697C0|nr:cytochrome P450 2B5-like [Mytilus californianus]
MRKIYILDYAVDVDCNPVLLATFICIVVVLVWQRVISRMNSLPGPRRWPVLGNIPALAGSQSLYKRLLELRKDYGDIIQLRMGPSMNLVVVFGQDLIKELLVDNADKTEFRPNWLYVPDTMFNKTGIIWSNGKHWTHLRKFAIHALKDLGAEKSNLEQTIQVETNFLITAMCKENNAQMDKLLPKAVSNIISNIVFGSRFEYNDSDFEMILNVLEYIFKHAGLHLPENFMPILANLMPNSEARSCFEEKEKIDDYVKKQIEKHKENYNSSETRDFIDIYLHQLYSENESNIPERSLFHMIFDLFAAGSETTSTTLLWIILYLIKYPSVQDLCRTEITTVAGLRQVSYADKDKMPYTLAVIDEVQRIASIGPIGLPRACMEDVSISGRIIPKHSVIIPHFMSAHYDEKYWENPTEFQPERFLTDDGKHIKHHKAFHPFSLGSRTCIGKNVAEMELFLFTTTLIQRCRLQHATPYEPLDMEGVQSGITLLPKPYKVRIRDRSCSLGVERQISIY